MKRLTDPLAVTLGGTGPTVGKRAVGALIQQEIKNQTIPEHELRDWNLVQSKREQFKSGNTKSTCQWAEDGVRGKASGQHTRGRSSRRYVIVTRSSDSLSGQFADLKQAAMFIHQYIDPNKKLSKSHVPTGAKPTLRSVQRFVGEAARGQRIHPVHGFTVKYAYHETEDEDDTPELCIAPKLGVKELRSGMYAAKIKDVRLGVYSSVVLAMKAYDWAALNASKAGIHLSGNQYARKQVDLNDGMSAVTDQPPLPSSTSKSHLKFLEVLQRNGVKIDERYRRHIAHLVGGFASGSGDSIADEAGAANKDGAADGDDVGALFEYTGDDESQPQRKKRRTRHGGSAGLFVGLETESYEFDADLLMAASAEDAKEALDGVISAGEALRLITYKRKCAGGD